MTQIIAGTKTEFSIDPAIMQLLPTQGSIELQRDAAGKVHHFHTHPAPVQVRSRDVRPVR
jgi:hypothetical protein